MIKLIAGPVKSGKTTKLYSEIADCCIISEKKIYIFDCLNPRNSDRELKNIVGNCLNQFQDRIIFCSDYKISPETDLSSLFIFDEIHFLDVFGTPEQRQDFLKLVQIINNQPFSFACISGIYYDYYNNFKIFPIWEEIDKILKPSKIGEYKVDKIQTSSFNPCAKCQSSLDVFYSISIDDRPERAGDHCVSVCHNCAMKTLINRKSI